MLSEEKIRRELMLLKPSYALRRVSIFGSYAEGRANEQSDLDLLVEFDSPAVSLIRLNQLKYALKEALGLPIDIVHGPLAADSMLKPGKVARVLD